ncbi:putative CRISPR-associated protein [Nostoc sp.]|uniref:putative CRISPR-associated protein n=1 Tax=Nostoc sp. TaxID=1180 RepID=UPI002FFB50A5
MRRLVISTVGTSLLTNEINERKDSKSWITDLNKTANWTQEKIENSSDYSHVFSKIILPLRSRVENKLNNSNIVEIREMSAELNGIYGLYDEQLSKGNQDMHYLIATDTLQGQVTAEIVQNFLRSKGICIDIFTPKGFSTDNNESFTNGIDELLNWIEDIIPEFKYKIYNICFNLVGGFKAIQGFANTIGMFYANEIIYIFEGSSTLIKIPRLPIKIDTSVIKPVEFALMAAENNISIRVSQLPKVPESLLFICDDEATLSNWGKLTWNNCKHDLFIQDLLEFPFIVYEESFKKDYKRRTVDEKNKYELHNALAEISATMLKFNGDTSRINPRLKYKRYEGEQKCEGGLKKNEIDHFYLNKDDAWRVSCVVKEIKNSEQKKTNVLHMRHFGEHDYVNNNP